MTLQPPYRRWPLLRLPINTSAAHPCEGAEEVGRPVLERSTARNARRVDEGRALRDEIRQLMSTHVGPGACTSERILARIARKSAPSLRTVQRHLQAIKRERHFR